MTKNDIDIFMYVTTFKIVVFFYFSDIFGLIIQYWIQRVTSFTYKSNISNNQCSLRFGWIESFGKLSGKSSSIDDGGGWLFFWVFVDSFVSLVFYSTGSFFRT